LLKEGDIVELDVAARQLNMRVNDEELCAAARSLAAERGDYCRAGTASYS